MTIAQNVRNHLRNKPYLLEALEKGIVNLSELSRQIQKELKTDNASAIKAALRRYSEELQKHRQKREEKVLQLLKRSGIAIYDRKSVIITSKELESNTGMKVDLLDKFVYLLDRGDLPDRINALVKHENCTMMVIHSPEELEATPGVVAFLATLLAEQHINIVEFISCWTETIMVVDKKDSLKAYEVLSNLMG
ncbi:MAG: ACT domain-containing protein [Candidatus Bathyarchaeota archaeon]|nr:ACT domain-containing protein [Candidatus Bathyarchaeota archaeon]MDD4325702.1 ACT domain-containing protein [Candidatus Bathyarchaeota archaeon]MDI9577478.1 ACT domain-containing protein [Thermoproteota archaeon]